MGRLSIITVTYHSGKVLPYFKKSLEKIGCPTELLIHDNTHRNQGLSKAVNELIRKASGDLLLFCNPDIQFDESIKNLVDFVSENPMIGAVPEFYNLDGTIQRVINRRYATVARIILDFTAFGRLYLSRVFPSIRRDYAYMDRQFRGPERIEQPGGSCLLMSKEAVLRVVPFYDERFPVLWNDVDMAIRARECGIQFVLVPSARVIHSLGHSTRVQSPFITMLFYSNAGMIGFAKKWHMHPRVLQSALFLDAIAMIAFAPLRVLYRQTNLSDREERNLRTRLRNIQVGVLRFRASLH